MKKSGGTGPTASKMNRDTKKGNLRFESYDPADGARPTNTTGFQTRRLDWRKNISSLHIKELTFCGLAQALEGKTKYRLDNQTAKKFGCPIELGFDDLNWLKRQADYTKIEREAKSIQLKKEWDRKTIRY